MCVREMSQCDISLLNNYSRNYLVRLIEEGKVEPPVRAKAEIDVDRFCWMRNGVHWDYVLAPRSDRRSRNGEEEGDRERAAINRLSKSLSSVPTRFRSQRKEITSAICNRSTWLTTATATAKGPVTLWNYYSISRRRRKSTRDLPR